jgi:hypothetical protein
VLVCGHVWHLAVLWEKFCGTQDLICPSLRNVVQVTSVVVHWWAQVPSVHIELYTNLVFLVGIWLVFLDIYQTDTGGKLGRYILV